jgi:hypothetical protein
LVVGTSPVHPDVGGSAREGGESAHMNLIKAANLVVRSKDSPALTVLRLVV